jgi:hypothetical protein
MGSKEDNGENLPLGLTFSQNASDPQKICAFIWENRKMGELFAY